MKDTIFMLGISIDADENWERLNVLGKMRI